MRTVSGKPIVNFILKTDRATIRGKDKSVADFAKITLLLTFPSGQAEAKHCQFHVEDRQTGRQTEWLIEAPSRSLKTEQELQLLSCVFFI